MKGAEFLARLSDCQHVKDYTPQCYVVSIKDKQMGHAVHLTVISDFLGRKNPQHAFLRRGSKAVGPMS